MSAITIVNNDGTSIDDFPKNPLKDKWDKMIRRNGKPCSSVLGHYEDGRPIMNYTCVLCHETSCHYSDSFIVPEEDREEYEKYVQRVNEYHELHKNHIFKSIEDKVKLF